LNGVKRDNLVEPQGRVQNISALKGQCHEIFASGFFSWVSFPTAPEYPIMTVSNFAPPVSTTPVVNFATSFASVVDTGGKIWIQYQAADNLK
jgi:hypothetical protein